MRGEVNIFCEPTPRLSRQFGFVSLPPVPMTGGETVALNEDGSVELNEDGSVVVE